MTTDGENVFLINVYMTTIMILEVYKHVTFFPSGGKSSAATQNKSINKC